MSKYEPLWRCVQQNAANTLKLSFDNIQSILGFPIDHSLLSYKKELLAYGYRIEKISLKEQTVIFIQEEKG